MIVVRLGLAVLLACLVAPDTGVFALAAAAVLVVGMIYELLRALRSQSIGRAGGLWLVVGAGYAIRVALGLALAGFRPEGIASPFVLLVVAAWSFGVMFVTLTWAMEATGLCFGGSGSLYYPRDLMAKPHQFHLLRFIGLKLLPADVASPLTEALDERPLARMAPIGSPWNAGLVLATSLGAAACLPFGWMAVVIAAIAGLGAVATLVVPSRKTRWAAVVIVLAVLVPATGLFAGWSSAGAVGSITFAFLTVYVLFRSSSPKEFREYTERLKSAFSSVGTGIFAFLHLLVRAFLGKRTRALLAEQPPPPGS